MMFLTRCVVFFYGSDLGPFLPTPFSERYVFRWMPFLRLMNPALQMRTGRSRKVSKYFFPRVINPFNVLNLFLDLRAAEPL